MNRKLLIIALLVAVVVVVALLASITGGVAIRRVETQGDKITISLVQPVVPGVQTTMRLTTPRGIPNSQVDVFVRDSKGTQQLVGQGALGDERIQLRFPCSLNAGNVTVVVIDRRTSQVLVTQEVEILPPGPDCR